MYLKQAIICLLFCSVLIVHTFNFNDIRRHYGN
jgi:hypothetical protein